MLTLHKTKTTKRRHFLNLDFVKLRKIPGIFLFLGGVGLGFLISQSVSPSPPPQQGWISTSINKAPLYVCFSPKGHCTDGIVQAIQSAKSSIYVQAYSFTSLPIAQALVEAKKKGVEVQVLLDKSQPSARGSQLPLLVQNDVSVAIDVVPGIAHNKIMIFDGHALLTGSFNFTKAADSRNAENVLLIQDAELARIYKAEWDKRAQLAKPYKKGS